MARETEAPERELRIVTDAMPVAAVRCSRDQRFRWANPRYASWVALPPQEVIGRRLVEIIGEEALAAIQPSIARVLKGEQVEYERLARLKGLGERWVHRIYKPTQGAGGEVDGWVAVGTDIHDRKLAKEALRQEYQKKDEFLPAVAHELRNPLAPIRNAVAILGRKGSQDPEVAWSQSVIERQIDQLSRLIEDLVDIERMARGRLELRRERVPFEAIVDMALETSRPHVNAAGHRLSVLMPSERVMLDADPVRLAQALSTLVRNAAKHTPAQGTISFSAAVEGAEVVVSVEDTGAGLDPALAAQLSRSPPLAGARSFAEGGLGGLEVRSAGPGRGAEFIVRLSLAHEKASLTEPSAVYASSSPVRVLVADDNRDAADSLQRVLALYGHEVRVAYDGASAVKIGEEFRPRVAVLDIAMPGTSGYEVAREIRRQQGGEVTLVAVTGWGQETDRKRAMESGFDYHLVKPVDPNALHQLLSEVASKIV